MTSIDDLLEGLNEAQREAVLATEGPLLILAGAGSGKTRVITHRVAYLIGSGRCEPAEIVAVTFTNKAAGEMKDRIARLLGPRAEGARIGTFHALCLRILRREAHAAGLPPGFQVFDTADQLAVLRGAMKDLEIDEATHAPRAVLSRISHAKNRRLSPDAFAAQAILPDAKVTAACYREYQERMRRMGGVDFDDLILEALRLLEDRPEIGGRYARGCRYLLVDEYQDTNEIQYRLIRALSAVHRNVCCVGDHDQSIYRFRGADIRNILDFENDFPDARVIKLERNYRSTKTILAAAGSVIDRNNRRHATRLWTEGEEGLPLHYHHARDDRDEAEAVVRILASLSREMGGGEIAVLYRTNNQSRLVEEALVRAGIRYRIVGSLRFYERKEIKDLLGYLRLLVSPGDDMAFARAMGTPARGLGKGSLEQLSALASSEGVSLAEAAARGLERGAIPARAAGPLRTLLDTLAGLRAKAGLGAGEGEGSHAPLIVPLVQDLVETIAFKDHLARTHAGDHEEREANVDALVSAAAEYDEQDPGGGLQGFLDRASLRGETDDVEGGEAGVTLLTIHSAKGLEFSAVVLIGLEENLFPHVRSAGSTDDLEEERRLCYVAITRAKRRLVLTNAFRRRSFGDFVENRPSRFLDDLPAELVRYSESSPWSGVQIDPLRSSVPLSQIGGVGGAFRSAPRDDSAAELGVGAGSLAWGGGRGAPRRRSTGPRARDLSAGWDGRRAAASSGSSASSDEFAVGRTVTHPMFGRGRILHMEGAGDGLKLTIRFQDSGTRKILPRATRLVVHD